MGASAGARDPLRSSLAGRRLGRYEVLTQLASGGMASVYVARAQGVAGFERLVAIKVLHPHLAHEAEFISMFLDEARLAAQIRHPNVVGTLDISDTEGDGYFLVMEYVEGDHLAALLTAAAKERKRMPIAVVVRVVLDALAGLAAAHSLRDAKGTPLRIVHRDVSPHNVMVGVDGVVRLTDFGVAKAEVRLSSTREGQFKGKLAYMAPEQASTGQADQRSDLFSMGIILWECLTGRRLFRGTNNAETLKKILHEDAPAPSLASDDLAPFDPVLAKALARDPEARYQSAEEFAEAIERAASQLDGAATSRAVADSVRYFAREKLAQEHDRTKAAMEDLGTADISSSAIPIPKEGSGSMPHTPSREGVDSTVAARPSVMSASHGEAPGRRATVILIVAVMGVAAVVIGAVLALSTPDPAAPDAPPATVAAPPDPPRVEPPVAVPAPEAAAQPEPPPEERGAHGRQDRRDDGRQPRGRSERNRPRAVEGSDSTRTSGSDPSAPAAPPAMEPVVAADAPAAMETPTTMQAPATMETPSAMSSGSGDDLLSNPYRR